MSLIFNKKAGLNYELGDKFEAGLELLGSEVKSLRNKHGNLEGTHIVIRNSEALIINWEIPPYQPSNTKADYNPKRTRRLLLNKKEILELSQKTDKTGLTIIPISVYAKGRKLKMEIAIAKGKKRFDKRETLKKKAHEREIGRTLKR